MLPEIRTVPDRPYVMVERKGRDENGFYAAGQAFDALYQYVVRNNRQEQMDLMFGIAPDAGMDVPDAEQRYQAGWFLKTGDAMPPDADVKQGILPGGRIAIFQHVGPYDKMSQTWDKAWNEWLPASGEKSNGQAPYEVYVTMDMEHPETLLTELCVPIE